MSTWGALTNPPLQMESLLSSKCLKPGERSQNKTWTYRWWKVQWKGNSKKNKKETVLMKWSNWISEHPWMKNTWTKLHLEGYHHKNSHSYRHIYILLTQENQVLLSRSATYAFRGDGHLEKSLKGVELSNCTVLLETQATSSPKAAGYYNNKQGHKKRATCQFLQPQKLLTLLWICFVWRTVKIISLSWGIMRTIQLAQFKQTESTATSVGSPGFLSVFSVSIHPWKNRLQAEKRGSHS